MGELIPSNSSTPPPPHFMSPSSVPRPMPARDDCWSEDATFTLIEAWGQRYLDLNRGNLRQKQWQEVADTVNARHGHIKKARRTDVQCKNRIDTLKKKYKIEKARVSEPNSSYISPWPFFLHLDHLIGNPNSIVKKVSASPSQSPSLSPPLAVPIHHLARNTSASAAMGGGGGSTMSMSMRTPVLPQKRPAVQQPQHQHQHQHQEEYFRKNYAAVAAAAAREEESEEEEAAAAEEEDDDEEEGEGADDEVEEREGDGIRKLARVIEKFGQVYARVEKEKQRQLIELEKQRMQFAKELECQRMQMLVEMQVQLEKIKRAKRSNSDDMYS